MLLVYPGLFASNKKAPNPTAVNAARQTAYESLGFVYFSCSRTIVQLQESLTTKQTLIEVLNDEKATLENEKVQSLVEEVKELKDQLNVRLWIITT